MSRAAPPSRSSPIKAFGRSRGTSRAAHRVLIYGPGGVGKSSLAAAAPGVIFADLERGSEDFDVERVKGIETWGDLRLWLQSGDFDGINSIAIDSITKAEELCAQHVIANVPHEKGGVVIRSIEDYGWGKGFCHIAEEWRRLLFDLERHYHQGRNIVLIAHDQDGKAPNPDGEDFLRHQPRLQNTERASVLKATTEWCDHVLYIGYDASVKDGKAKGSGTRAIYCSGTPTVIAKTRSLPGDPIPYPKGDTTLWQILTVNKAIDDSSVPM